MNGKETSNAADLLKALGDETRLRIIELLEKPQPGEKIGVCGLSKSLDIPQPTVSHHIKVLKSAGIVVCRKHATFCYYTVDGDYVRTVLKPLSYLITGLEGSENDG